MMKTTLARILPAGIVAFAAAGLSLVVAASFSTLSPYDPVIDPSDFSQAINNPFFTLTPGVAYTYKSNQGREVTKVVVTNQTRKVMGVDTRVVWERVWLNDQLIEETYDWYAQDKDGSVWYFGEDSTEYKDGKTASKSGSWEAGTRGAKPGIVMQARPRPGTTYRQEYSKGHAEDMAQILSLDETVQVPYGSFKHCLKTKDWSPIERGSVEHKYYSREVGNVVLETENNDEKRVELVEVTTSADKK
jgi:hypothetical protein